MAELIPLNVRLFHAVYVDCNGPNGSPGTGMDFSDPKHAYNCAAADTRQESNRVYGGLHCSDRWL